VKGRQVVANAHPIIPPFPADIDRNAFGHWLSGFTDGEGCFYAGRHPNKNQTCGIVVRFSITLREDDVDILRLIQSYFCLGKIRKPFLSSKTTPNAKPVVCYDIMRARNLIDIIIPHFKLYSLRAKKRHDFVIWERAVELSLRVAERKPTFRPRTRTGSGGAFPKWTSEDVMEFDSIVQELRQTRKNGLLDTTHLTIPEKKHQTELHKQSLFCFD
jgi:hypothetical protein